MTKLQSHTRTAWWKAVVPVFGGAVLVVACSASSTSKTSTASPTGSAGPVVSQSPSPQPSSSSMSGSMSPSSSPSVSAAGCQHVKSLRGSLTSLTHISYNGSSATVISADLKNIQAQLTALKSEPGFSNQANKLSASIAQVESAAHSITAVPTASQVQAVIKALTSLKATATPMMAQMKAACP